MIFSLLFGSFRFLVNKVLERLRRLSFQTLAGLREVLQALQPCLWTLKDVNYCELDE